MPFRGGFPNAPTIVACYDETPGGGDPQDINAPRNAPALDPASYLDKITWHSSLFQYEIAYGPTVVTVNHPAVAGIVVYHGVIWNAGSFSSTTPAGVAFAVAGQVVTTDHLLVTHGLGYVPKVMVVYNGSMLSMGQVVQISGQTSRTVTIYATSSGVYLREVAISSDVSLPATSLNYTVLIFRNPTPNPLKKLFQYAVSGLSLAKGIVDSSKKYLRRTGVGDSPFSLNLGPTIDAENGGVRYATGGVVVSEPRYTGSMAAPPYVQVGVD